MAIPASAVGLASPPVTSTVEPGRLRLFATATGQADPLYTDAEAARAHGYPDLPVPPTFLFGLELEQPEPFRWIADLGVDLSTVLHGTQSFTYHAMAFAGDTLTATSTITDVYSKKAGALEFIERRTEITRDEEAVATLQQTTVVRHVVVAP